MNFIFEWQNNILRTSAASELNIVFATIYIRNSNLKILFEIKTDILSAIKSLEYPEQYFRLNLAEMLKHSTKA